MAQTRRVVLLAAALLASYAEAACLSRDSLEAEFVSFFNDSAITSLPTEGSCCQMDICGIPCSAEDRPVKNWYGEAVIIAVVFFVLIGVIAAARIKGDYRAFFVAGRTLSLPVTTLTLASQCIDSNAVLGNADLSYRYHFYDGAVLPLGLGLSLLLNGMFLARHMNRGGFLTLPDLYGRTYGPLAEVVGGILTIVSFLALLAGNLVGCGTILAFLFGVSLKEAIIVSGSVMFLYTASGGILSVAYSDIAQSSLGITGIAVCGWWCYNHGHKAPPDSIGFPGYAYPDTFGQRVCSKYDGVPCEFDPGRCCYNADKWCDDPDALSGCRTDNAAYWWKGADDRIFDSFPRSGDNSMLNPRALWPFPNAIFWNWATVVILAFGNLAAIDFQARCMAAKSERTATAANLIAGSLGIFVGVPLAFIGGVSRFYYGPDSIYAKFDADTCSRSIDFPTCAQWKPDPKANLRLLTHEAPNWLGAWTLIGIVAASMSTSDGAILAMSTVGAHNLFRRLPQFLGFMPPDLVTHENLLFITRVAGLPFTIISILVGMFAESDHSAGATGYLLIVAFDIVLAGCVAPIFFAFYVRDPSPRAGLAAMLAGTTLRVVLEFSLPKDGNLILPFKTDEFLDYGKPKTSLLPTFFDAPPEDLWTPGEDQCPQKRLRDFTGVDSLAAPLFSIIVFFFVHYGEKVTGKVFMFLPQRFAWMLEPVPVPAEAKAVDDDLDDDDDRQIDKAKVDASAGGGEELTVELSYQDASKQKTDNEAKAGEPTVLENQEPEQ
mmetsp:Transcript_1836/g.6183  ORF Transcript_1836/g.6183 Transcript_1836/m.6183 type:complete len:773 (-) Transcript_1836:501-2819(-)|eukprot:CAMPEP_0118900412 /NCGR_PEP_ID=MMETSP1166-20130328/6536_1 /TAXON_ID=1104430 /ORGANISM="Chrysoreinhardia sp, Strain CCMP3193" /LENGTH=772 /DNA_ID=CAMNT_0006839551 /DNA_START=40 /DNA_END=2358 /DNA_ORIENTATION=-